jgi:hypothetical protein
LPENPDYTGPQPIILDLDNDGVEINFGTNVYFDVDDDGFKEATSWAAADDGFLVIDLNEDGARGSGDNQIDQTKELVFTLWGEAGDTDLQALRRVFDDNNDAILNDQDDVWDELRVWKDSNQNGESDDGELRSLAQWGITQINLGYDNEDEYTSAEEAFSDESDNMTVFGNTLHGLASFTMNGEVIEGGVGDVALSSSEFGWRRVETDTGYRIELESGRNYHYTVLDGTGSASLDLVADWLDGAAGDARNNTLDASSHSRSVQISGGEGNDVIIGGQLNDMLSGDDGADELRGGSGNDLIFFDALDTVVLGGSGYDIAIYDDTVGINFDLKANGFEVAYGGAGDDVFQAAYSGHSVALHGGDGKTNSMPVIPMMCCLGMAGTIPSLPGGAMPWRPGGPATTVSMGRMARTSFLAATVRTASMAVLVTMF